MRVGRLTSDDRNLIWNLRTQKRLGLVCMMEEFPNKIFDGIFSDSIITNSLLILRVK